MRLSEKAALLIIQKFKLIEIHKLFQSGIQKLGTKKEPYISARLSLINVYNSI